MSNGGKQTSGQYMGWGVFWRRVIGHISILGGLTVIGYLLLRGHWYHARIGSPSYLHDKLMNAALLLSILFGSSLLEAIGKYCWEVWRRQAK